MNIETMVDNNKHFLQACVGFLESELGLYVVSMTVIVVVVAIFAELKK